MVRLILIAQCMYGMHRNVWSRFCSSGHCFTVPVIWNICVPRYWQVRNRGKRAWDKLKESELRSWIISRLRMLVVANGPYNKSGCGWP